MAICSVSFGFADIAIASFFRNGSLCWLRGSLPIAGRGRSLRGRCACHPAFEKLRRLEQIQLAVRSRACQALLDAGARLTVETLRRARTAQGVMRL